VEDLLPLVARGAVHEGEGCDVAGQADAGRENNVGGGPLAAQPFGAVLRRGARALRGGIAHTSSGSRPAPCVRGGTFEFLHAADLVPDPGGPLVLLGADRLVKLLSEGREATRPLGCAAQERLEPLRPRARRPSTGQGPARHLADMVRSTLVGPLQ